MRPNVARSGGCPPSRGQRLSKADVHLRLDLAHRMLLDGKGRNDIVTALQIRFGMSTRAADRYLAGARERAEKEAAQGRDAMRTATVERLDALSRKVEKAGQFASAVGAERLRAQTLGLLAPSEFEVKSTVAVATPASPEPTPAQVEEEFITLVGFVAECVTHGTINATPELAVQAERLRQAIQGSAH